MRKITLESVAAFLSCSNLSKANMTVTNEFPETVMRLHGNCIARSVPVEGGVVQIRLYDAGWQTTTTKERLNGLLRAFAPGYSIYQRNFEWYLSTPTVNMPWLGCAVFTTTGEFLHQVEA